MHEDSVRPTGLQHAPSLMSRVVFCFLLSSLGISQAFGACHVVTPSGSGAKTGADWNNAYAGIPAKLTRGDVYYLADGTYPAYTFTTAGSGTLTLEIRKAQSYDNCTSTGWSTTTMGSAQAVFAYGGSEPILGIDVSYVTVNGNGQLSGQGCGGAPGASFTSEPPTPSDCGIRVDNTGCTSSGADACSHPIEIEGAFNNYAFEYIELVGNGNNASDTEELFAPYGGGGPSLINHLYGRDAGCVYLQYDGSHRTVSNSYFWGTEVNGASGGCHGQAEFYSPPDSNYSNFNNVYRDITGSDIWTWANPGTGISNNLVFYNDVIYNSPSFTKPDGTDNLYLGTVTDGVIGCFNSGVVCTNITFVQNTMVNLGWGTGLYICDSAAGCSATIENNLWYEMYTPSGAVGGTAFTAPAGGTFTQTYNSFLSSGSSEPKGTQDVSDASAPNPFVSWTTGNFHLASENADWNGELALGAPYTTDASGVTRSTDRGAYQFVGAVPPPPTNVTGTVIAH